MTKTKTLKLAAGLVTFIVLVLVFIRLYTAGSHCDIKPEKFAKPAEFAVSEDVAAPNDVGTITIQSDADEATLWFVDVIQIDPKGKNCGVTFDSHNHGDRFACTIGEFTGRDVQIDVTRVTYSDPQSPIPMYWRMTYWIRGYKGQNSGTITMHPESGLFDTKARNSFDYGGQHWDDNSAGSPTVNIQDFDPPPPPPPPPPRPPICETDPCSDECIRCSPKPMCCG